MTNIMERAVRNKVRIVVTGRGNLAPEDLYDLEDSELNSLWIQFDDEINRTEKKGLASKPSSRSTMLRLKRDLIEMVYNTVVAEKEARQSAADNRQAVERLENILAEVESHELRESGAAAIRARINELKA